MKKKKNIIVNNKRASPASNTFQTTLITLLAIGFICCVCFIFYLQENGNVHLPDNVLYVLASAVAILIVRSYHIMIKARFNNNSS